MNREIIIKILDRLKKVTGLHIEDDAILSEIKGYLAGLLEKNN